MISKKEWQEICAALLDHHSLFYKIVEMGRPILTDSIPTACVTFDKDGKFFNFLFNPTFWNECSFYKKTFVVAHEALHIILNHGKRFQNSPNPTLSNVAIDIVVNHSLVNRFGFVREQISDHDELCWVDTIFKNQKIYGNDIHDDENAEYYLNLLQRNQNKVDLSNLQFVDSHNFEPTEQEVYDVLNKELTEEEKKGIKGFLDAQSDKKAGEEKGSSLHFASQEKLTVKKRWETVIKNWARKIMSNLEKDTEQWAKKHRRFTMLDESLFLPSDCEIEDLSFDNHKVNVHFYLDTSGSCWHLKDRFFAAAESLPAKFFNVRLFCFDTGVAETTLASRKITGGGGTRFDIIEQNIQKDDQPYPDAVFVITDLYGNKVTPQFPDKWYWFVDNLNESVMKDLAKNYLPANTKVFSLNEFV